MSNGSSASSSSLALSQRVRDYIRNEVGDWDDDVVATARFKAFSGQRSDWLPKYAFWRDLILKVASHLGIFLINPSEVKEIWFNRGGLTPLCLDDVLAEMYKESDILRSEDLVNQTSGRLFQIFRRIVGLVGLSKLSIQETVMEDHLILMPLLKDKAGEVVKVISENCWTSSCTVTMRRFQSICGGSNEASAVLSYLSGCRKAQYLATHRRELMEGVKVSLSSQAVSSITTLDYDVLHLISTEEKLQQQLDVINQRWNRSRKLALASLQSGAKKVALKHAKELKLTSESREKCTALLNRVEEVLRAMKDAESTNKVSEAIQIGARAIKENMVSVEEVQLCLEELEETIDSQRLVDNVIESTSSYAGIEDEDAEAEFKNLELELGSETFEVSGSNVQGMSSTKEKEGPRTVESLTNALSGLGLVDSAEGNSVSRASDSTRNKSSKDLQLELA